MSTHVVPSSLYPAVHVQLWPVIGATWSLQTAFESPLLLHGEVLHASMSTQLAVLPLKDVSKPVVHWHLFPNCGAELSEQSAPVSPAIANWLPPVTETQPSTSVQYPPRLAYPVVQVQENWLAGAGATASTHFDPVSPFELHVFSSQPFASLQTPSLSEKPLEQEHVYSRAPASARC